MARSEASWYCLPSGDTYVSLRRTASETFACPSAMFAHVGLLASSKSAMNTRAPELRALMSILASVGPVISTRRSDRSAGAGGTRHSALRTCAELSLKVGRTPRAKSAWSWRRRSSSSARRVPSSPCSSATRPSAVLLSTAWRAAVCSPWISMEVPTTAPSAVAPRGSGSISHRHEF